MKKYIPVIYNVRLGREVIGASIYADNDLSHDEVVKLYCEENECTIGEVNPYGAKLLRIECDDEKRRILILSN